MSTESKHSEQIYEYFWHSYLKLIIFFNVSFHLFFLIFQSLNSRPTYYVFSNSFYFIFILSCKTFSCK